MRKAIEPKDMKKIMTIPFDDEHGLSGNGTFLVDRSPDRKAIKEEAQIRAHETAKELERSLKREEMDAEGSSASVHNVSHANSWDPSKVKTINRGFWSAIISATNISEESCEMTLRQITSYKNFYANDFRYFEHFLASSRSEVDLHQSNETAFEYILKQNLLNKDKWGSVLLFFVKESCNTEEEAIIHNALNLAKRASDLGFEFDLEIIKRVCCDNASDLERRNHSGQTPLELAMQLGLNKAANLIESKNFAEGVVQVSESFCLGSCFASSARVHQI